MATLAVADIGDGTGATATITSSSGGANVVYYQLVTTVVGAGSWTSGGSRTGDGAVTLSLGLGYYFAYCLTGGTVISNLCYFQVTDSADAVMTKCFNAVVATLTLLNKPFTQLIIDSQYEGEQPTVNYPCTVVSSEDVSQTDEAVVNARDDIGNPVYLQIMIHCVKFDNTIKNTLRKYRQDVFRAFNNQRLSGVTESIVNKVEFGEIAHVKGDTPHARSELTIRCITREVRGLGA